MSKLQLRCQQEGRCVSEVVKLTPEHLHELKIFCSLQTGCFFF